MKYATKLSVLRKEFAADGNRDARLFSRSRVPAVGWKGLIDSPHLDNSQDIGSGLKIARRLLLDITGMGLPAATEFLDPIIPQYTADLDYLGGHRRAHDRIADASRAGQRPFDAGRIQERHGRQPANRRGRHSVQARSTAQFLGR